MISVDVVYQARRTHARLWTLQILDNQVVDGRIVPDFLLLS